MSKLFFSFCIDLAYPSSFKVLINYSLVLSPANMDVLGIYLVMDDLRWRNKSFFALKASASSTAIPLRLKTLNLPFTQEKSLAY
jgi:hypothetical protein